MRIVPALHWSDNRIGAPDSYVHPAYARSYCHLTRGSQRRFECCHHALRGGVPIASVSLRNGDGYVSAQVSSAADSLMLRDVRANNRAGHSKARIGKVNQTNRTDSDCAGDPKERRGGLESAFWPTRLVRAAIRQIVSRSQPSDD